MWEDSLSVALGSLEGEKASSTVPKEHCSGPCDHSSERGALLLSLGKPSCLLKGLPVCCRWTVNLTTLSSRMPQLPCPGPSAFLCIQTREATDGKQQRQIHGAGSKKPAQKGPTQSHPPVPSEEIFSTIPIKHAPLFLCCSYTQE